jgi:hypothetical protein
MFFDSVELMYDYIEDPDYMDGTRSHTGICYGIESKVEKGEDANGKRYSNNHFKLYFDDQESSQSFNIPN